MNPKLINILPVMLLACEIGNVADHMGRTKGAGKYMKLVDLFDEVNAVGSVNFKSTVSDFKALGAADRAELFTEIKAKFDIADDKLEAAIEEGLAIIVDGVALVDRAKAMMAAMKA